MKNFLAIVIVGFVFLCLISAGCKKGPTEEEFKYLEATITHMGFDFSAGISDTADWENNDGETIPWQPGSEEHPDYPNWGIYIWWRNSHLDTVNYKNQTKDMGEVDISSVSSVPAEWDTVILPLLEGHTIVARCKDGYVKFEVLSTDTTEMWPANVKYYYSTSSTFEY